VLARAEERGQDVVLLPVVVVDERELGVPGADDLGLVAADVDDVLPRETGGGEGVEDPLEHRATHNGDERLGDLRGLRTEAAAPACADDDGPHG
jgi:hypothetical protein